MATEAADKVEETLRAALVDVLGLDASEVAGFDGDTELFGAIPELDSMAVAGLLTEIEDRLDIWIEDDEFEAEMLETFGNLLAFAKEKALQ
ncbi:phosphopantetheine-binding protein [Parasphingopyxis sp.]|uniref:phosphopantetheine-binding protein n=1 Tax=Parasphingopyxis sp. TaxID=1920299 RepID=UPI002625383E|nr:phosphopantetheine-binding protein [Parasphingopyxis sp.]